MPSENQNAPTLDIPAFGGRLDVCWDPNAEVTQWGGLCYLSAFLNVAGLLDRLVEDAPFVYTSNNSPGIRNLVGTIVLSILCGFTRYLHIVGRIITSGRRKMIRLTSSHAEFREIQEALAKIGEFMKRISSTARQLGFNRVWELIQRVAFRKFLSGGSLTPTAIAALNPIPLPV